MGRPVVYCDKCGKMLREDDFSRGQATTFENRSFCAECRPLESYPVAPAPPKPFTPKPFNKVSTTRIPKVPSGEFRIPPLDAHGAPPPAPPAPTPPSRAPLVIGGIVVGVVVLGLAMAMMSGGGRDKRSDSSSEERDVRIISGAPRASRGGDSDPPPQPVDPAKAAFAKAVEFRQQNPGNLAGQFRAFDDIVQRYGSSPLADVARRELTALQRRFTDELSQIIDQARVPLGAEDFKAVVELWQRSKSRYDLPDWVRSVDDKIRETNDMASSRFALARDQGVEAKKGNNAPELAKARDRVAKWGMPGFVEEFDRAIAAVTPEKTEATGKPLTPPTKEAEAYRAAWSEAALWVARRQIDVAAPLIQKAAELAKTPELKAEAARDLEDVGLVARAASEGRAILAKLAKGQKATLAYRDDSGALATVEGVVAACDGYRIELKKGEESVLLLVGEISGTCLGEAFRARPAKLPTDPRAVALLTLLEGDVEGAKKLVPEASLPEKALALAPLAADAARTVDPKENDARKLFADAESAWWDPVRGTDAAKIYKSLLADFGDTGFVRRNKAAIAARADGLREIFLSYGDLGASNNFKMGKHGNVEGWISSKDLDAAQLKESYVQLDFSVLADTEYRLWVQVGGCCQEVFTFFVQGTDLSAPNPKKASEMIAVPLGGDAVGAVKTPYSSLKKRHVDHTGPKEPDRWEWVQIPLPKYASAGPKSVRLLTLNKGFAVAAAVLSPSRPGPPKEADWKEWDRTKAEAPGYALYRSQAQTGGILREFWLGIPGGNVSDLTSHPNFPDKPTGSKVEGSFTAPRDWADEYGTRMRGWVHVPVSGKYTFWIAADDTAELWLSSDDTADKAKLQKLAVVSSYTAPDEWGKFPQQQSQPIELVAGRRYYIEALHKEGVGGDHVSVGWQLPDGRMERPIPGNRLSPWRKR
jgi:hypothetical protein